MAILGCVKYFKKKMGKRFHSYLTFSDFSTSNRAKLWMPFVPKDCCSMAGTLAEPGHNKRLHHFYNFFLSWKCEEKSEKPEPSLKMHVGCGSHEPKIAIFFRCEQNQDNIAALRWPLSDKLTCRRHDIQESKDLIKMFCQNVRCIVLICSNWYLRLSSKLRWPWKSIYIDMYI